MANPITWQNLSGPNFNTPDPNRAIEGFRSALQGASDSYQEMRDRNKTQEAQGLFSEMLAGRVKPQEAMQLAGKQGIADSFMDLMNNQQVLASNAQNLELDRRQTETNIAAQELKNQYLPAQEERKARKANLDMQQGEVDFKRDSLALKTEQEAAATAAQKKQKVEAVRSHVPQLLEQGEPVQNIYTFFSRHGLSDEDMSGASPELKDYIKEKAGTEKARQKAAESAAAEYGKKFGYLDFGNGDQSGNGMSFGNIPELVSTARSNPQQGDFRGIMQQRAATKILQEEFTQHVSPNGEVTYIPKAVNPDSIMPKTPQEAMKSLHETTVGSIAGLYGTDGSFWSFLPGVSGPKGTPVTKTDFNNLGDTEKAWIELMFDWSQELGTMPDAVQMVENMVSEEPKLKKNTNELLRVLKNRLAEHRANKNGSASGGF